MLNLHLFSNNVWGGFTNWTSQRLAAVLPTFFAWYLHSLELPNLLTLSVALSALGPLLILQFTMQVWSSNAVDKQCSFRGSTAAVTALEQAVRACEKVLHKFHCLRAGWAAAASRPCWNREKGSGAWPTVASDELGLNTGQCTIILAPLHRKNMKS